MRCGVAAGHLLPLRGQNEHSTDPLDKLSGGEKLARCVFQSACVGEVQYHLIDAAKLWQSEMAAQFMALLGGNPFPRKKQEIPYREFDELCLARRCEREADEAAACHQREKSGGERRNEAESVQRQEGKEHLYTPLS